MLALSLRPERIYAETGFLLGAQHVGN